MRAPDRVDGAAHGIVYIVGAGPGSPDLITVKGLACIRRSDVILHDRLVHPELLSLAPPQALVLDVGKRRGREDEQQHEIHALMIAHARQGKTVCRLKGGDPFIFGRAAEEIAALTAAGVPFEVVPGVSSITAAPAAAGIPLTHRNCAHGFLVLAGSRSMDFDTPEWRAARVLLQAGGTVVVAMGLGRIDVIAANLVEHGCSPDLPVAVISKATWPDGDVRKGALRDMHDKAAGMAFPALLVLGTVTHGLADKDTE